MEAEDNRTVENLLKKGNVKLLHKGDETNLNVQVTHVSTMKIGTRTSYRIHLNDGRDITKNAICNGELNSRVLEEITYNVEMPVIKIIDYFIENNCVLIINDFKLLCAYDKIIGEPFMLTKQYYDSLRKHKGWTSTPSRMKRLNV